MVAEGRPHSLVRAERLQPTGCHTGQSVFICDPSRRSLSDRIGRVVREHLGGRELQTPRITVVGGGGAQEIPADPAHPRSQWPAELAAEDEHHGQIGRSHLEPHGDTDLCARILVTMQREVPDSP